MATANSLMTLSDSVTTITIMDSAGGLAYGAAGYRLKYGGYAPKVAGKREVLLGGQTPYNDVEEHLTIEIKGATAGECYSKLETLVELVDQATRWFYNEIYNPLIFTYQPKGSELTAACKRLVLRAKADNDATVLPQIYDDAGTSFWLAEVTISFICRGLWHTLLGTDTNTQSAKNSGNIISFNMVNAVTLPNPTEIQLDLSATAPIAGTVRSYLIMAASTGFLGKVDASSLTGTHITSVADAGSIADGNILRFTPTVVNENQQTAYVAMPSPDKSYRAGFYCTFRCTTITTVVWQCRVVVKDEVGNLYYTPYVTLQEPGVETGPQPIYLGSVACDDFDDAPNTIGFDTFSLQFIGPSSIAGTPKLDIDTIIVVALDNDYSAALKIDVATTNLQRNIHIRNQPLSRLVPVVHQKSGGTVEGSIGTYDGNTAFYSSSTLVVLCWLATVGANWRYGSAVPALIGIDMTVTRDNSYLIPL